MTTQIEPVEFGPVSLSVRHSTPVTSPDGAEAYANATYQTVIGDPSGQIWPQLARLEDASLTWALHALCLYADNAGNPAMLPPSFDHRAAVARLIGHAPKHAVKPSEGRRNSFEYEVLRITGWLE